MVDQSVVECSFTLVTARVAAARGRHEKLGGLDIIVNNAGYA